MGVYCIKPFDITIYICYNEMIKKKRFLRVTIIDQELSYMKQFIEDIEDIFKSAFAKAGYDESYGVITVSKRADLCEYQCNGCMSAAKAYKKKPIDIAGEVIQQIGDDPAFEKVEAVMPGFINITVSGGALAQKLSGMAKDECFGFEKEKNPKTVVIDYGGANVAKPLHVGHLRSAVIGESVKRIISHAGNKTIGDVHLGDWGLQMGLIIEQLKDDEPDLPYFDEEHTRPYPHNAPFTLEDLERIYPKASGRSKEDEAFLKRAQDATLKLQSGYEPYVEIWKHIMTLSKADLKKNYDALDVHFDLWKGESDAQPLIPDMVEDLKSRGIAVESRGALVVDVSMESDTKEVPPCIIQKSDGAALYATSDLATIIDREKSFSPDEIIYVADKRQELHFTQVFRTAKKAGITGEYTKLEFLGFGTMNGKDGKPFKTRAGGVMRLEHLIEDIKAGVYDKITESDDISGEEIRRIVDIVGLAALKYGDLSNQASRDYVFDIDRFTSFEGNTGPYILYTVVRIKSIIDKYMAGGGDITSDMSDLSAPVTDKEKTLMIKLTSYPGVLEAAYKELAPHRICQFIYEVSDVFNGFYHDTRILSQEDEEQKKAWIKLLAFTKDILVQCLKLLAIDVPDRM